MPGFVVDFLSKPPMFELRMSFVLVKEACDVDC